MSSRSEAQAEDRPRSRTVLSPLRYPGGKRRLVPYIGDTIAANGLRPQLFIEPFAGGASVSLELLSTGVVERIAIGDADPMVAAFWKTVFTDAEWLCHQVERVPLDLQTWERMKTARFRSQRSLALACLYLNRTSFNGSIHPRSGPIGGKAQTSRYGVGCRFPRRRLAMRIRACAGLADRVVLVGDGDALETTRTARDLAEREGWSTLTYLDPPFWAKADRLYRLSFQETEHERLADQLHWRTDPWLLSYDAAPEIRELYLGHRGARIQEIDLLYTGTARSAGRELVITNLAHLPAGGRLWRTETEWLTARSLRPAAD